MKPDIKKYLAMIDDWDMTREQKIQYIHDLWHIMESHKQTAIIYARVSSVKQVKKGDGLGSQETRCREYADHKQYQVIEITDLEPPLSRIHSRFWLI